MQYLKLVARWTRSAVLLILLAAVLLQLWYFSWIVWWNWNNPVSTSFMRAQLSQLREKNPNLMLQYRWVNYAQISPQLKRAVIAAEDGKFTDHDGVDWDALEKAYEKNLKKGKVVAGGSTITQQLAKNLFLSGDKSYVRKAQEFVITWMLELVMSKRRILELYLNVAEWGEGVFGAEAGAWHHYKTNASKLSAEQASRMAAMLPRPRFYDKNPGSPYLARYAARIQARMGGAELP